MDKVNRMLGLYDIHRRGITGKNITVAILDTGIYRHPDIKDRIIWFEDIMSGGKICYDNNGHGTHIAGIIGGNGTLSNARYMGAAPECNILMVKVLDQMGKGNVNDVIRGLEWIIENKGRYNIKVLNISIGTGSNSPDDEDSDLVKAVEKVWDAGITVVVAAGNNGPDPNSITVPGISRKVITVGASDDKIMRGRYGVVMKDYSGRGPTLNCIQKPDILAPSKDIVSCKTMRNYKYKNISDAYTSKSGTSMSTPIVAGIIALLLQQESYLSPKDVKVRIRDTARDLNLPRNHQGWGLINPPKLIKT